MKYKISGSRIATDEGPWFESPEEAVGAAVAELEAEWLKEAENAHRDNQLADGMVRLREIATRITEIRSRVK